MDYSKLIKFIREKLFLSQTDLANLLDVSFSSISRWEAGTFEPTIKAKKKISELCKKENINLEGFYDNEKK